MLMLWITQLFSLGNICLELLLLALQWAHVAMPYLAAWDDQH